MARGSRLKVYRTPIGFHDTYVAAPSQKAALAAWGSGHDLFSTAEPFSRVVMFARQSSVIAGKRLVPI